jgi:hypothetical protein
MSEQYMKIKNEDKEKVPGWNSKTYKDVNWSQRPALNKQNVAIIKTEMWAEIKVACMAKPASFRTFASAWHNLER